MIFPSGCYQGSQLSVSGVYSLHISDTSIHHGVDILVLNNDSTYVHIYTKGSSGKDLMQSGHWERFGSTIGFDHFVAWDLFGPLPDGVMYPDPANTSFPLSQGFGGNYEIDAGPDRGEKFIQIERD